MHSPSSRDPLFRWAAAPGVARGSAPASPPERGGRPSMGRADSIPSDLSGSSSREGKRADLGEEGAEPFVERLHGTRYYG